MTTLIYSIIFLVVKGKEVDAQELTLIYFLTFTSIISIVIMFPLGQHIIREPISVTIIITECEKITNQSLANLIGYTHGMVDYKKEWKQIDDSPFLTLREIGINYLRDGNQHVPALIIKETTNKFKSFIVNEIDRRALSEGYNVLFIVWNGVINEAFKSDGYLALKQIWSSIQDIHEHHAEHKIGLIRTEQLEDFIRDFVEKLLKNEQEDVLIDGLRTLEHIYDLHIEKSLPNENLLANLAIIHDRNTNIAHDVDQEIQWNYVVSHIPHLIDIIIDKALTYKKERIVNYGYSTYNQLLTIAKHATLGSLQEQYIVTNLYSNIAFLGIRIAKSDVSDAVKKDIGSDYTLQDIIEKKPSYIKQLVAISLYFLTELQNLEKLELRWGNRSFLHGPTRLLFRMHEQGDDLTDPLSEILDFIKWLKCKFEENIKLNAESYIELHSLTKSLIDFSKETPKLIKLKPELKADTKIDTAILSQISQLCNDFKSLQIAKTEIEKQSYKP